MRISKTTVKHITRLLSFNQKVWTIKVCLNVHHLINSDCLVKAVGLYEKTYVLCLTECSLILVFIQKPCSNYDQMCCIDLISSSWLPGT